MIGVVEVYRGNEKVLEESNMLMDHLGDQIAFWMTLPRGFSGIPSASSIYDTSNYTVRAATLGKDAAGYSLHGHSKDLSATIIADGIFRVLSYEGASSVSYRSSETAVYYLSTDAAERSERITRYNILPEDSKPTMSRLESGSTRVPGFPTTPDLGHNLNYTISGDAYKPVGCYAPAGNSRYYMLSSLPDGRGSQALINNNVGFNSTNGVNAKAIDSRGFIRVTVNNIVDGTAASAGGQFYKGLLLTHDGGAGLDETLSVGHVLGIEKPDFLALNFFGGIYTIGLWGFDLEKMREKGMYPPFSQYSIEDLEYKLFARKTFTKDLTYYEGVGAFQNFLEVTRLTINWRFKFK